MQRTRSSPSALRSPLMRCPLGASDARRMPTLARLVVAFLLSAGRSNVVTAQLDTPCLSKADFRLGGVVIEAKSEVVRKALGNPLKQIETWNEDDGGRYKVLRWQYPKLDVDIDSRFDSVERLATTSPDTRVGSESALLAVRVGMTLGAVLDAFGTRTITVKSEPGSLHVWPIGCDQMGGGEFQPALELLFHRSSGRKEPIVVRIAVTNYGP